MGKRPIESDGEPSSSNCGYSAEDQAHHPLHIKKAPKFRGFFLFRGFFVNTRVDVRNHRASQIQC